MKLNYLYNLAYRKSVNITVFTELGLGTKIYIYNGHWEGVMLVSGEDTRGKLIIIGGLDWSMDRAVNEAIKVLNRKRIFIRKYQRLYGLKWDFKQ